MNPVAFQIRNTVPVVSTDDIQSSISYYTKVLGFLPDFEFGNPVSYAGVKSGDAEIYFTHDPDLTKLMKEKDMHPDIFIWISDAASIFKEHKARGATIIETISDRPWGARQYVIREINGYHLKFAEAI